MIIFFKSGNFHLGVMHKPRSQLRGEGGLAKCLLYNIPYPRKFNPRVKFFFYVFKLGLNLREGKYQGRVKLFRGKGRQCKLYIKVKVVPSCCIDFENNN